MLDRDDLGMLTPSIAAGLIGVLMDRLDSAGAQADPPAAPLLCTPPPGDLSVINGQIVVKDGKLLGLDLPTWLHGTRSWLTS